MQLTSTKWREQSKPWYGFCDIFWGNYLVQGHHHWSEIMQRKKFYLLLVHTWPLDQCSLFKSQLFLQHLHGNINPDISIYQAAVLSWGELQGFTALLTHRSQENTTPGQGWTRDLREETLYFTIYVQTHFVRKPEKVRVTTVLRGKLLPVSIQRGSSSNILSNVNFNNTTAVFHKIANDNLHSTPQLKHRNIFLFSFLPVNQVLKPTLIYLETSPWWLWIIYIEDNLQMTFGKF